MDNFNLNYTGFPRRNIVNDRRYGLGQNDIDLQRLNDQMISLRREVQLLSSSMLNLYNITQTNNTSILNIENILQNRYSRTPRTRSLFSNYNRINTLQQELLELERLTNLVSRMPRENTTREENSTTAREGTNTTTTPINLTRPNTSTTDTITRNSQVNTTTTPNPLPNLDDQINNTTRTLNNNATSAPTLNSQVESILFNSLVETLNNEINSPNRTARPLTRPRASFIHPNILEVTYSTDHMTNNLANMFRDINFEEDSSNVITTHATISRNTEIIVKEPDETPGPAQPPQDGAATEELDDAMEEEQPTQNNVENRNLDNFCVICHENINEGQVLRRIKKCGHCFHIGCLDRWLENKITCPTCRADIRLNIDNNGNEVPQPEADNQSEAQTQPNNIINSQINVSR